MGGGMGGLCGHFSLPQRGQVQVTRRGWREAERELRSESVNGVNMGPMGVPPQKMLDCSSEEVTDSCTTGGALWR